MILIKFKNLEKSEMAKEAVSEKIEALVEKFPDLAKCKIQVTLEMENSPMQAGPDFFKVKLLISSGKYSGITIEKAHSNLYVSLAEVSDHILENLNRVGDKIRIKNIKNARKIMTKAIEQKSEDQHPEF